MINDPSLVLDSPIASAAASLPHESRLCIYPSTRPWHIPYSFPWPGQAGRNLEEPGGQLFWSQTSLFDQDKCNLQLAHADN
jgi:hypothetical protein